MVPRSNLILVKNREQVRETSIDDCAPLGLDTDCSPIIVGKSQIHLKRQRMK